MVIAGPTASGKSALALALSRLMPVTIINADASQVYADLQILSARPGAAELELAPHALFGHIDGAEACSAARWAEDAKAAIARTRAAGRVPVLAGGTGLYLRTLLEGIAPVPEIDPAIRAEIRALAVNQAHAALARLDPAAATRLSPLDKSRIARALEVVRATGRTLADWQRDRIGGIGGETRIVPMILLPPRAWLHARCDARFLDMMAAGAEEEVARLLARGLDPALPVMKAIGVAEVARILKDPACRAQAIADAQAATRRYVKRQTTWFRHQPPPDWPRQTEQLDFETLDKIAIKLREMTLTD